ncbi:hypothetical protein HPL003_01595 [Paenibacillus terrae HPL-003]|uniref:Uncharacterized protein n=1 Tax=Paenibacillus terrae (strain HPL-003) TaxID=985665 RepID=G7VWN8_PAETH|nr:hypothetical protein [Paenibacillus terrae]AET57103.1 hypothetical protein HPL003_01595 [Paenibacillus terrae HPL-003]
MSNCDEGNPEQSCSGFFARMAYDHCESHKSASSRGRFHAAPYGGMVFSVNGKKSKLQGQGRLAFLPFALLADMLF